MHRAREGDREVSVTFNTVQYQLEQCEFNKAKA